MAVFLISGSCIRVWKKASVRLSLAKLEDVVDNRNWCVIFDCHAVEALEIAEESKFAIIFLDEESWGSPGGTGWAEAASSMNPKTGLSDWHSVRESVDVVVDLRHGGADWWIVRDIGNVDRKMLNRKRVARRKDKDRIAEA
ncbi:hypothetical protein J000_05130 [Cryptococcus neoformans]|nr:hypothetical protein J000_05130 [Cryptococcus neoformans var. grubii]